jgi:hypothetical protein
MSPGMSGENPIQLHADQPSRGVGGAYNVVSPFERETEGHGAQGKNLPNLKADGYRRRTIVSPIENPIDRRVHSESSGRVFPGS